MFERFARTFVRWTGPFVRRAARAYGLRVQFGRVGHGQHPLIIESPAEEADRQIPLSVYFNTRSGSIRVGRNTVFGEDVKVLTGMHMGRTQARDAGVGLHTVPEEGRDISIGQGCYIGSNAVLIGPLKIGNYAMIGAGSVLTHDVPANAFVAGVPARVIRTFED